MTHCFKLLLFLLLVACGTHREQEPQDLHNDTIVQAQPDTTKATPILDTLSNLRKYSYLIHMRKKLPGNKDLVAGGTGFFIRLKQRLFFISCYHVFFGYDQFGNESPGMQGGWDDMDVRIQRKDQLEQLYLDLNKIKSDRKPRNSWDHPDVYVYEFDKRYYYDPYIYSIESIINFSFIEIVPDRVCSFGYPYAFLDPRDATLEPSFYNATRWSDLSKNAKIDSFIFKNAYFLEPEAVEGMSGSPIYFRILTKAAPIQKDSVIAFGGIMSMGRHDTNSALAIKAEEIVRLLNEK